ncbi:MAG: hypothetical protein AAB131_13690 [Actinomycetota bacterium]
MRTQFWRAVTVAGLLVLAVGATSLATPFIAAVEAAPSCGRGTLDEAQLDALFAAPGVGATDANQGFGGGDYPHAYPLPDGRVLWMFQDLHFSNDENLRNDNATDVANGTATNAVHNGAIVQQGTCFTVQGSRGRDFIGDAETIDSRTWFWPLDGEIGYDGNLWIFMAEMHNPNGAGATYPAAPVRSWLAILDPVTLRQLYFAPATDTSSRLYGWSVVSTDRYSYLYSHCYRQYTNAVGSIGQFDASCMPHTYLARVPRGHFDAPPEYWTGAGWSTSGAAATAVVSRNVANPMSVQWFGDTFVSVTKQNEWWGSVITIDRAAAAQGPWQTVQTIAVGQDMKCGTCGNYGAFLMPWLDAQGRMVIALSSGGNFDLWRSNAWLYRPTFYSAPLPAASPPFGAATPPAFTTPPGASAGFVPVDPVRLVDTREAGQPFTTLPAGGRAVLDLRALAPAGATSVALNLTADRSAGPGFVRAYPCVAAEPTTSNLNPSVAAAVTNAAIVPLGDGRICFTTLAATDLIVDLNGWLTTGSSVGLVPTAERLVDTRSGLGGSPRLASLGEMSIPVTSSSASSSTTAVALSITAVDPSTSGFVTAWPCGTPRPTVSNLNPVTGITRPNLVNVRVGAGGRVCLFTSGETDLVVDKVAEYRVGSGARYTAVTPQRLLDTRVDGHRYHASNLADVVPLGELVAAQVNLTATETSAAGFLTAYPCLGSPWPGTSNANFGAADTTASAALMASSRGYGCVFSMVPTQLVVDISGVWR